MVLIGQLVQAATGSHKLDYQESKKTSNKNARPKKIRSVIDVQDFSRSQSAVWGVYSGKTCSVVTELGSGNPAVAAKQPQDKQNTTGCHRVEQVETLPTYIPTLQHGSGKCPPSPPQFV